MLNCTWWSLFAFWLQVLQDPDSSPFIRSMRTPTTCPKPIPGVCYTQLHTHMHVHAHTMHTIFIMIMEINTFLNRSFAHVNPFPFSSFNRIDIPPYESYDKLYDKLLTAIEETCGFAVEWETHCRVCLCMNMWNCVQDSSWTIIVAAACWQTHSESWTGLQSSSSLTALHILPLTVWTAARESFIVY